MADKDEYYFYQYRKENPDRIYVGREFPQRFYDPSRAQSTRRIKKVINIEEDAGFINVEGEIVLNVSGKGSIQTRVIIYKHPDGNRMSMTLQRFGETRNGVLNPRAEVAYTFSKKEWYELLKFMDDTRFIDLSDPSSFKLDNYRKGELPSVRLEDGGENRHLLSSDILQEIENLSESERAKLIELAQEGVFTKEELDVLSGRKDGLIEFENLLNSEIAVNEKIWQDFFERNSWIFGYGLDYKFLQIIQRESSVSDTNIDGKNTVISDYLMSDSRFTTLIELKRADTDLFEKSQNRSRSWRLSSKLTDAVSQILAQKADWQIKSERPNYKNSKERITEITADPRTILIIGHCNQFDGDDLESITKARTFELYRRNLRNIDVYTFDELYERARFIVKNDTTDKGSKTSVDDDDLPF